MSKYKQGYFVEHNGDCWQSVFPASEANKAALHTSVEDALNYMVRECAVEHAAIVVVQREEGTPLCARAANPVRS